MPFPPANLSQFHNDVFSETLLGQLCGKKELFRDRYLVLRMLGRGGFGVTFLAQDFQLPGRPLCVIKQLCPRVSDQKALDTARLRFKREAKTLAALGSHSQIPLLLDYFTLDGDFYLVQEYVRGMTLARLVRRQGCQPERVVKRILRELVLLLDYIHERGVIHRDVKPQNVILCQDGRLVLIDFGAVKEQLLRLSENTTRVATTHFVGTVGFAPPEQFSLRPVYASDLYALGVTCLYLLTGKAPLDFQGDRRTGELQWRDRVEVSASFAAVLSKMLKPSLQDRYSTAAEICQALDRVTPQDNLAQCMAQPTQPTQPTREPETQVTEPEPAPRHRSQVVQTARAIRDWKARRTQVRLQRSTPRELLPSSG
ncbi:MAG: serine/threonine protein kinase [Spirulinaceae cyanobacterium RM2_2_10]|nr:serine/threonine protein kinase [Spirulinaceae cyanobacterium SM2_1_0]NJO20663.1 serine/threonine protein kinase [Spirulinaceae cyanobacterium RM2_2_10]